MDNINISFAADKSADSEKRLNDIENFISLLTDRIKFCLADINDDVASKSDGEEEKKLIYETLSDGVGEYTNTDKNCEIFNDYENNVASSYYAHAEGYMTTANAPYSHAEGYGTVSREMSTHAEGRETTASGNCSHAENTGCIASGPNSHAEGYYTMATGEHSHASGNHTVAGLEVFALGSYNKTTDGVWLVVGNGSEGQRSDALVLDRSGNLHIAGKLTADGGLPAATADALGGVIVGDNINVSDSGTISVDLSPYLKNTDIADWAKANEKPSYTAGEVGAAEQKHTHTKSEITDFPTLGTAAEKNADYFATAEHTHTAGEIGAAEKKHSHSVSDITDMPTKLPANGGNADTVDGKHASEFAAARHTHTAKEVGAATSADITAAITGVEIGGRNLLYNSRFDKKYSNAWAYSAVVTYAFDDEVTTLTKAETATRQFTTQASVSNGVVAANPNLLPENGCTYTISCEVMKAEGYDVGNGTKITNRYNFKDGTVKDFDVDVSGASETAWTKYSRTYTYASDKEVRYTQFIVALGAQACGIKIRNVKFEKGNKPTDWSPAPEDDERRIASLEARVAALEAAAVSGGEV